MWFLLVHCIVANECLNLRLSFQGLLAEGKEGKRNLDKKMAEYESARSKHVGHKQNSKPSKWRKAEDQHVLHDDMIKAQVHRQKVASQHACIADTCFTCLCRPEKHNTTMHMLWHVPCTCCIRLSFEFCLQS